MTGALNTTLEIVASVPSNTEAIIAIVQVSSARERLSEEAARAAFIRRRDDAGQAKSE